MANKGSSSGKLAEIAGGPCGFSAYDRASTCGDAFCACESRWYFEIDSPGRRIGWYPGGGPYSDRSGREGRSARWDDCSRAASREGSLGRANFDSGMRSPRRPRRRRPRKRPRPSPESPLLPGSRLSLPDAFAGSAASVDTCCASSSKSPLSITKGCDSVPAAWGSERG